MKTKRQSYPAADILAAAGRAAWDWYVDTGGCHFCTVTHRNHEDWCPLLPPCADSVNGVCPVAHEHDK
jgi:hypothetical protein